MVGRRDQTRGPEGNALLYIPSRVLRAASAKPQRYCELQLPRSTVPEPAVRLLKETAGGVVPRGAYTHKADR